MAKYKIFFENPRTGQMREAPVGFSWTVFFFGPIPALFRGHWAGFFIILLLGIMTFGVSNIFFWFAYNKIYLKHVISEGFIAKSATADMQFLQQKTGIPLIKENALQTQ